MVSTEEKRLLLTDPDVLVNRLNRVESILAILNATVKQQSTENQQMAVTIQQQNNMIQQQQTSIQKQQTSNLQQQTLVQQHEQTIKQLQGSISILQSFGATYTRWGRKQCPNNKTELVYSGYAGGGYYGESGSSAEYVCLPPDPNYVKTSASTGNGRMYGGEFDTNFFASNSGGEDAPCALCRINDATTVVMIPGKNTCYSGWRLQYHGYLSSGRYSHAAASAYVCVDINPEYIIGGVDYHYGKLFYEVVTKCGALKCPPYIDSYPLTCVVCSK